jgi:hypothetical protein
MPAYNLIGFDPWVRQLMPQIFNYWTRQGSEGAKKEEGEDRFLMVFDGFWHFQSFWLKLSKVGSHRQSKKLDSGRSCHEPISFAFILPLCSKGCKGVIFYPDSALSLSPNLARPSNTKHSAHPPLAVGCSCSYYQGCSSQLYIER